MTRVSSNAGKHPYLRPDFIPPVQIEHEEKGIPIDFNIKPFFKAEIYTEYKDKNSTKLFFKDIVTFQKEQYEIEYNGKEFYWQIINPKKTFRLSEVYKSLILFKKYNKKP